VFSCGERQKNKQLVYMIKLKFFVLFLENEPPDFPVDMEYLNEIRKRVSLARTIDQEEHKYVDLHIFME
jgi:hypothetical protein